MGERVVNWSHVISVLESYGRKECEHEGKEKDKKQHNLFNYMHQGHEEHGMLHSSHRFRQ